MLCDCPGLVMCPSVCVDTLREKDLMLCDCPGHGHVVLLFV